LKSFVRRFCGLRFKEIIGKRVGGKE